MRDIYLIYSYMYNPLIHLLEALSTDTTWIFMDITKAFDKDRKAGNAFFMLGKRTLL